MKMISLILSILMASSIIELDFIDNLFMLFSEFILTVIRLNDYVYIALIASIFIVSTILIVLISIYNSNKANSSIRIKTLLIGELLCYDICAAVLTFLFQWWLAIILIIICTIFLRKGEKFTIEQELKRQKEQGILKKDDDTQSNNIKHSLKEIIANIVSTFFIAQLIIYILPN